MIPSPPPADIATFWAAAVADAPKLPAVPPGPDHVWAFGDTPEQAENLLALVLSGVKTATSSAFWEYEASGDHLPEIGQHDVILDSSGVPRAVTVITDVEILAFEHVSAEHAYAEGENDRSLSSWRRVHREFFTRYASHDRGFEWDMPVVCERFRVEYKPRP